MRGPLGGHLGDRISALLDGQLEAEEADRAWAHVHRCHACRDLVEREGWIKTRLSGLSRDDDAAAPADLKGMLKGGFGSEEHLRPTPFGIAPGEAALALAQAGPDRGRRASLALAALGGGAAGAAMMGLITLGAAPADAPTVERQPPTVSVRTPTGEGTTVTTVRRLLP